MLYRTEAAPDGLGRHCKYLLLFGAPPTLFNVIHTDNSASFLEDLRCDKLLTKVKLIIRISGNTLNAGRCFTKIEATKNVSGEWQCHIGTRPSGVEIRHNIQVRVATQLAAVQQNIKVLHGDSMTIACVATKGLVSLSYCRFEPPAGEPFNINSDVTSTK